MSIAKQTTVAEMRRASPEVVHHGLQSIAARLTGEVGPIAGSRLLVTGGAGFLGYYFVEAIHRCNGEYRRADTGALLPEAIVARNDRDGRKRRPRAAIHREPHLLVRSSCAVRSRLCGVDEAFVVVESEVAEAGERVGEQVPDDDEDGSGDLDQGFELPRRLTMRLQRSPRKVSVLSRPLRPRGRGCPCQSCRHLR
jgi:hypothetical protein